MISEEHSFLFIHRGKSGGNSLTKCLLPYCKHERIVTHNVFQDAIRYFDVRNIKYNTRKHAAISEFKEAIPERTFNALFKFTTIRNPYDRIISAYWSPIRVKNMKITEFDEQLFIKTINDQRVLRDFICLEKEDKLEDHIDYIIKFEDMDSSISELIDLLRIESFSLPHVNKSKRKHYSRYITPKLKVLIDNKFGEEIEYFNYKFEKE